MEPYDWQDDEPLFAEPEMEGMGLDGISSAAVIVLAIGLLILLALAIGTALILR